MPHVLATVAFPADIWHAVQHLAPEEGDANPVILRVVEEYITASRKRPGRARSGKYQKLVTALSTPVAALHLSARPATALQALNIRYVCELVQKSPLDLFRLPNFGEKSLREVTAKLATLGLTLGMPLGDDAYRTAVVAAVAANLDAARTGAGWALSETGGA